MTAMTRFTLRSLAASRVRTLVTIAGVALAAALLTAVMSSYASLQDFLYRSEVQANGTWTAEVRVPDAADVLPADQAPDVSAVATLQDVGFAANGEDARSTYGAYVPVLAAEGPIGEVCGIEPYEGRLPASADEIMLPDGYRELLADGPDVCALGDVVELDLGQRELVVGEGAPVEGSIGSYRIDGYEKSGAFEDGMRLDSDSALVTPDSGLGADAGERLVDLEHRAFTVVGFYDKANLATVTSFGMVALCGPDPQAKGSVAAYLVLDGVSSIEQLDDRMDQLFPGTEPYLHSNLLRAMGVRSEASIWDTLYAMAAVLALVIVVACVSLISNAFAISVAERTRQFGLLSSIGASRRQLRRSVLLEALVVAAIGVPLGLLVGIGGTAAVLAALGPSMEQVLGRGVPFQLHVSPEAIVIAAVLALASVLVSAWVPARRAARSSAIDALRRTADIRMPRRATKAAAKGAAVRRPWKSRGLAGRVLGIGGQMASINAKRGAARGRTASLSLALAIVLLMSAGSLTTYLSVLVDAAGAGAVDYDVAVAAHLTGSAAEDGAEALSSWEGVCDRLAGTEGAEPRGWYAAQGLVLLVPEGMAGSSVRDAGSGLGTALGGGQYAVPSMVVGLSDQAFRALAQDNGLDADAFFDAQAPSAIALGQAYGNDGVSYLYQQTFAGTGTTQVVVDASTDDGRPVRAVLGSSMAADEPDADSLDLVGMIGEGLEATEVPFEEVDIQAVPLDVRAVVDEGPVVRRSAGQPTAFVPASMLERWGLLSSFDYDGGLSLLAAFDAPDHAATAQLLKETAQDAFRSGGALDGSFVMVTDYQADMENMNALILVVNVFCLLFTGILTLIAMANVFNTIANGLILRRREFAIMKSVGMGNRAFRSMIGAECVRYSLRGLVPGVLAALLVSYGLYRAMALSVSGLSFALPWGYMGLAVALVAVALLLSVAYGLHRCKASNVVEALRDIA